MHNGHGTKTKTKTKTKAVTGTTAPGQSGGFSFSPPSGNVGYNQGQVDPGLAAAIVQQFGVGMPLQQANKIAQQAMGSTGQGFGITGTGNFGQDTSGQDTSGQDTSGQDDDNKKEKKKVDVVGTIKDFYDKYKNFGGIMGLGLLPFRMIAEPNVETFQNPQALAVLKLLFDEKGQKFKDEYLKDHGDLINEAFKDDVLDKSDSFDFFNQQLEDSVRMSEEGILGAGSQEINFPAEFYTGEKGLNPYGAGGMPQTTGGLANLAGLDVNQFTSGPGYNQQMVDMIFAAREELNRMGNQQGGGQGIMAASSAPPGIPVVPPTTPVVPPTTPVVPPTTTTPFDLAQFYAGLPTFNQSPYARQGLGSYNEILRRYYG
jgi:hypothetical protein